MTGDGVFMLAFQAGMHAACKRYAQNMALQGQVIHTLKLVQILA